MGPGIPARTQQNLCVLISLGGRYTSFQGHGPWEKTLGFSGTLGPLVCFRELNFKVEVEHLKDHENAEVCFMEPPGAREYK